MRRFFLKIIILGSYGPSSRTFQTRTKKNQKFYVNECQRSDEKGLAKAFNDHYVNIAILIQVEIPPVHCEYIRFDDSSVFSLVTDDQEIRWIEQSLKDSSVQGRMTSQLELLLLLQSLYLRLEMTSNLLIIVLSLFYISYICFRKNSVQPNRQFCRPS